MNTHQIKGNADTLKGRAKQAVGFLTGNRLVVLLFVPNCRAPLGYEHEVATLSAPFPLEQGGSPPSLGAAPSSRGPCP